MTCEHLDAAGRPELPGDILTCHGIRCCDSSPRRHATAHFRTDGHPVIRSAQPGETWRWCYVDEASG
jgi:hypothetical protein